MSYIDKESASSKGWGVNNIRPTNTNSFGVVGCSCLGWRLRYGGRGWDRGCPFGGDMALFLSHFSLRKNRKEIEDTMKE